MGIHATPRPSPDSDSSAKFVISEFMLRPKDTNELRPVRTDFIFSSTLFLRPLCLQN